MKNTVKFYSNLTNWDLIVQVLHWDGPLHDQTPPDLAWNAYRLADGFGRLEGVQLRKIGWDWSHLRDSTDEGHARVAEYIRKNLTRILRSPIREDVVARRRAQS
jgi:hypothetical protein